MYAVSGIPEVDFDAVEEVIGAGGGSAAVYRPIIDARLANDTELTIRSYGLIDEDTGGWVEAVFKVAEPTSAGPFTAQFAVIQDMNEEYPWSVRAVLTPETVMLSSPGESLVVYRDIPKTWTTVGEVRVVVWIEDLSPHEVYNAQIMPDPYQFQLAAPLFADEIDYSESSTYDVTLRYTGTVADVVTVSVSQDVLPDGVSPSDWTASYRLVGGVVWETDPSDHAMDPGEELGFEVRFEDLVGDTQGMGLTTLMGTSQGDVDVVSTASFATFVETPSIIIVDDDGGADFQTHLQTAVTDTGYFYRDWDTDVEGRPSLAELSSYWAVLWTTADAHGLDIRPDDEANLMDYLDGGGNLFLASMNYLSSRPMANAFTDDYLHLTTWTDDVGGFVMTGVPADPISDGMSLMLLGGPIPAAGVDAMEPEAPAVATFTATGGPRGIRVEEAGHKIVFTGFPFEDVKTSAADPDNQKTLVARVLDWFEPTTGIDGEGDSQYRRVALGQNFPNPFNPTTTIAFTVPTGAAHVNLVIHNVNGQVVRTLVDGSVAPGPHSVVWDGKDDAGKSLASGIYFSRIEAGGDKALRKMALLK